MGSFRTVVDDQVRFSMSPQAPCPCGSGKPDARCCLTSAGFNKARYPQCRGRQDEALGRCRGGLSTKIHVAIAGVDRPLRLMLSGGEVHDSTKAEELISEHSAEHVIADKAYDSDDFVARIESYGAKVVIPPRNDRRQPRNYDKELYKQRNKVERFINRIKHYRRAATRYEKTARNFLAFWLFAAVMVLVK